MLKKESSKRKIKKKWKRETIEVAKILGSITKVMIYNTLFGVIYILSYAISYENDVFTHDLLRQSHSASHKSILFPLMAIHLAKCVH